MIYLWLIKLMRASTKDSKSLNTKKEGRNGDKDTLMNPEKV